MECGLCGQPIIDELEALLPRHDQALLARQVKRLTQVREEIERDELRPQEIGHICQDCMHFMGAYGHGNLLQVVDRRLEQIKTWQAQEA